MNELNESNAGPAEAGTPNAEPAEAGTPNAGFKLDWRTIDVELGKGRFVHTLRHPSADEQRQYDAELQTEIPIGRDGAYQMPDPTANEIPAAKLHDAICESVTGYSGEVPTRFKASAIQHLYRRELDLAEGSDIFDDTVLITEEAGDICVTHAFRQPTEEELRQYRRKTSAGEMRPGKRGKQIFVTKSDLRTACDFYDKWIVRIEGATVGGSVWSDEKRAEFLAAVDPLVKRMIIQTFAAKLNEALLD